MYAPLTDSFEWAYLNKDGQVTDRVNDAIAKGEDVTPDKMATSFSKLKNRVKSPIMSKLIDAISNGFIHMVYTPQDVRIPLYLPFVLIRQPNGSMAGLVFLSNCNAMKGEDEYMVDEHKLKVSLESCYMALKFVELKDSPKLQAPQILRPSSKIYAYMVSECINRKHSIKLDPDVYNQVIYVLSRFFIGTTMGAKFPPDQLDTYCLYNCTRPDISLIHKVTDQFTSEDYKNIATVLQKMASVAELKRKLGRLTITNFLESYINVYEASMLLALENYPYFVYNVLSVNEATYVNNYHVLKGIMGKDGKDLYAALITTICGA